MTAAPNAEVREQSTSQPPERVRYFIPLRGERPPFQLVAAFLWGRRWDYDSDGDSETPDSTAWTELTLVNRKPPYERVDVDPADEMPSEVAVTSRDPATAARVAYFLAAATGSGVRAGRDEKLRPADSLLEVLGDDFDLAAATHRVALATS